MTQRQMVSLENDAVRLRVSSAGARVESVELLNYNDRIGDGAQPVQLVTAASRGTLLLFLGEGPLDGAESATHELIEDGERTVTFGLERDGVAIRRTVTLDERGYGGELRVSLVNRGDQPIEPRFELAMYGRERAADAPDHFQTYQLVASVDGDLERMAVKGIESPGFFKNIFGGGDGTPGASLPAPVEWSGVESQYFLLAALAENPRESSAFTGPVARDTGLTLMRYPSFSVPPGRQVERVYRLYFGPKLADQVTAVDARLDPAVQVGWQWVRPIVDGFSWLLVWCHDHLVGNYGAAIIMLTILLRLATFPLTQKSMTSMKRFGEIAPLMKDLQAKYKDDKQKLSEEMMKLYKTQGVNPVTAMGGGCLPMLIQMPFMIALYFALQGSIELRHAPFIGWIQDLSAPEQLFAIAGIPVRVLPLAMGASMLLQQRLSPQTGDPQQRQMMMWMSVVFTFMFYQFPAGLLLYWFVSNLLGIGQQLVVNRNRAPAKA
jgi:YidC/Oxa1 family membrane protein insertase